MAADVGSYKKLPKSVSSKMGILGRTDVIGGLIEYNTSVFIFVLFNTRELMSAAFSPIFQPSQK
jgi:hypothetical protein